MRIHGEFADRDVRKLLTRLVLFELCLVLIYSVHTSLGSPSWTVKSTFDLDAESNIPAWFSSVQLFLVGLVFYLKSHQLEPEDSPSPWFFRMAGLGFMFLSADEAAWLHEKFNVMLEPVQFMPRFQGNHGIWLFIYGLLAVGLAYAAFRPFTAMWKRYRQAAIRITIGVGLFLLGAVALEVISYEFLRGGRAPLGYVVEVAMEEFLEMFGASVVLCGAITLLRSESHARTPMEVPVELVPKVREMIAGQRTTA